MEGTFLCTLARWSLTPWFTTAWPLLLVPFFSLTAGKCAARGRSAVRSTGWKTVTCGAPPAAGRKPVRDSPTDPTRPVHRSTSRHRSCRPEKRRGRGLRFACTWSFCGSESQLSVKLRPLFHVSESLPAAEANEGWPKTKGCFFHSAVQDS